MKGFYVKTTLPGELIELLEVIVLQGSDLFKNKNHLQNLLILTGDPSVCPSRKVMECITSTVWITCDDKPDIAKIIAVGEEVYCLYEEEALAINIKCWQERVTREMMSRRRHHIAAVEVMVDLIRDLDRGKEFAECVNIAPVVQTR